MDCKASAELIMKYLDREISKEQEKLLYEHLDSCKVCSLEFKALKDMFLMLDEVELEEPPAGLEMAVISRIQKEDEVCAKMKGWRMGITASLIIMAAWLGLTLLVIYTPVVEIAVQSFNSFLSLAGGFLNLIGRLWRAMLTSSVKLLTVGRALGTVMRSLIEMYNLAIIVMILFMAVVLRMYGYMFKAVRR